MTGPNLGLADALATALAVAGRPGLELVQRLDGYDALLIGSDGSSSRTRPFPLAYPQRRPVGRSRILLSLELSSEPSTTALLELDT